jgi:hypothetical protein
MDWQYGGVYYDGPFSEGWFVASLYGVAFLRDETYCIIITIDFAGNTYLLSKSLRNEGTNWHNPPAECQFATKEEAMAVCERHYQLLMLQ